VAAAWEILGDPAQRRRFGVLSAGAQRGQLSDAFLNDVANAIERAETWIRDAVLPHYARYWRGRGAEMATRLFEDREALLTPKSLLRAGWWSRRAVRQQSDRIHVVLAFGRSADLSVVRRGRSVTQVVVLPQSLWDRGFRDSLELDDVMMRLLLARFAQLIGAAQGPGNDGDWAEAVERARAIDGAVARAHQFRWAGWAILFALIATLLSSAIRAGQVP
jgi:hypothetical protein